MAKEQKIENPEITITLRASDLYQITLCIGHRIGGLAQQWATAPNGELAKSFESQTSYLEVLNEKVKSALLGTKN